jgi:hypothetical protein
MGRVAKRAEKVGILAVQHGALCHYCRVPLEPETTTVDHVWPYAYGGPSMVANLVLACPPCNVSAADECWKCWCKWCSRARFRFGLNARSSSMMVGP